MTTLAGDMILLAFDAEGGRLPVRQSLAPAVRGALLAELLDGGALTDEAGAAGAVGEAPQDAALREVWQRIAAEPGRKWLHWVRKDGRASIHAVLRGLEKDGLLERSSGRVFGVFPLERVGLTPAGLAAAGELRAAVTAVVEDPGARAGGGGAADGRVALLAGLAHAGGQLGTVLAADRRRAFKERLTALSEGAAPVSAAVRRAVQDLQGAAVS
ncbi:GPP34 family phosphoprotein [Streptomyces gardneri]|uniref:GOLPH3/VPS74 family protein n=1 Tax=Streptomyces gardneri TaxID=66892 RepID=UPI0006BCEA5B|nr:GPP34 family phosphoprotein [Streptomyces gardneri]QPK46188.1 GPP34 family phosphoprotein [Streptomyces gardneri]WRK37559.1 GPP34 family phosphoprotein [Streptomyces venezuelae]CUM40563.1 putative integral membrane protein [Streptomyces venezuelae]